MPNYPTPAWRDADRLIYGGLLGLSVAGSLQLIGNRGEEGPALLVAGYAFAGSVPLLAASLVTELVRHRQHRPDPVTPWRQFVGLAAAMSAVAGLSALFFHLGPVQGGVFLAAAVLAAAVIRSL
ncbi:MAG TPA: hypothetical protein VD866_28110 [Urbifossiella sp.]|nr:hypothetical protein [Urbifossiella sp.]